MAYVVRRGSGYELRESRHTEKGPRSRTLATFRVLDDVVTTRAIERAERPIDATRVRALASAAGAPIGASAADSAAQALLREAAQGRFPSPILRARLTQTLQSARDHRPAEHHAGGAGDWATASLADRGDALRQLMDLTDRLPRRRPRPLAFPPIGRLKRGA